jgi:hypothetical protein
LKEAIGTLANRREANGFFPPWRKPTKHTHEKDKKILLRQVNIETAGRINPTLERTAADFMYRKNIYII